MAGHQGGTGGVDGSIHGAGRGPGHRADPTAQLAELFMHTARRLRRGSTAQLAPLGLTYAQARTLRLVAAVGPMRMADLAAQLEVVPRSVTTMVDALERAGLAAREADRDDRRSVLVVPTAEGRRLIDRLDRARRDSATEVFGGLSPADRRQLHVLLDRLCARGSCVSCGSGPGEHGNGRRAMPGAPTRAVPGAPTRAVPAAPTRGGAS